MWSIKITLTWHTQPEEKKLLFCAVWWECWCLIYAVWALAAGLLSIKKKKCNLLRTGACRAAMNLVNVTLHVWSLPVSGKWLEGYVKASEAVKQVQSRECRCLSMKTAATFWWRVADDNARFCKLTSQARGRYSNTSFPVLFFTDLIQPRRSWEAWTGTANNAQRKIIHFMACGLMRTKAVGMVSS